MSQQLRITVSGDLEGDFVVIEALSDDEFVIAREHSDARSATADEFVDLEAEPGTFLPPDGEG